MQSVKRNGCAHYVLRFTLALKHIGPSFQGRGATLVVPPWFNQRADSIQAVRRLHSTAVTGEPVPVYLHSLLPCRDAQGGGGDEGLSTGPLQSVVQGVGRRRSHLARRSLRSAALPYLSLSSRVARTIPQVGAAVNRPGAVTTRRRPRPSPACQPQRTTLKPYGTTFTVISRLTSLPSLATTINRKVVV